ncbi:hypothetical protein Hanom_Chr12g01098921 [Helianthus anomalus]
MKGVSLRNFEYTLILYHTKHSCCYLYLFIVVRNKVFILIFNFLTFGWYIFNDELQLSDDGVVDDSHVIPLLFKVSVEVFF